MINTLSFISCSYPEVCGRYGRVFVEAQLSAMDKYMQARFKTPVLKYPEVVRCYTKT